jgi:penicillin-binding protein 2
VRVYYISVKSNDKYSKLASINANKVDPITPIRATITDVNGKIVAVNRLGFGIYFSIHLKDKKLNEKLDILISHFPYLKKDKLIKIYKKNDSYYNHSKIKLVNFIPYKEMIVAYSKLNLVKDITILPATRRHYPNKKILAHVVGYVARANKKDIASNSVAKATGIIGKSGIEKYYNEYLQGANGYREYMVNAANEEIKTIEVVPPKENKILKLTIDLRVQKFIHELFKDQAGAVIVMNVNDGSLLAAGSFPEYDINLFVDGISTSRWKMLIEDLNRPFPNKITKGLYPPGSVVKMGIMLSYLENGIHPSDNFTCKSNLKIGNRRFRCWKSTGHGKLDVVGAIRESCDDWFYKGSLKIGIDKMSKSLSHFSFANKTGIDLPQEFIGVLPSKKWKLKRYQKGWFRGETLNTSIGQGYFLVTPIQIATYMTMLSTGKWQTPHLLLGKKDNKKSFKLSNGQLENLDVVRKGMFDVMNHPKGTANRFNFSKQKMAGKTGTAQVIGIAQDDKARMHESQMKYYQRSHAWLATYLPFSSPKFTIVCLVEHGGHGGSACGAMVSKISNYMNELGYFDK